MALPYIASHRGVSAEAAGAVVAAAYGPHAIKFLWAPLVDTTFTKKTWYLIALALICGGTIVSAAMPISSGSLPTLTTVVVVSQVGLTLVGMACENFLAFCVPEREKGRASGWYQAGNFVGLGCGGGLALWLSEKLPQGWMVGAVLSAIMLLSAIPLWWLDEPGRSGHTLGQAIRHLAVDLKHIVTSRPGVLGLLVCLAPIGAGAGSAYFGPIADGWHASLETVALVTGALSGIASAVGAMGGGWLADRMNRKLAYCMAGGLTTLTGVLMAVLPHTEAAFIALTVVYAVFQGTAYAAFTAFVLETIGGGAVATKYNIFASIANVAIKYMISLDGRLHTRYGPNGMFYGDAVVTFAGIAVLLAAIAVLQPRRRTRPSPE